MTGAFICGVEGSTLRHDERAFLRDAQPWGVILFARNCRTPDAVRGLTHEIRDVLGRDAPILIDQEGGLVQRLKAPHWPDRPTARHFGELYRRSPDAGLHAAEANARLIAHDLHELGVTVNCAPVLDVASPETHGSIGSRAYSDDPAVVAALAEAVCRGLMAGGVLPVVKHMPGQGRADHDTHYDAAVVTVPDAALHARDMKPFMALSGMPMGMTCHVVFSTYDDRPATLAPRVVKGVIRETIGFDGLLMTDDISMKALGGDMRTRAAQALTAGCDMILHCNGDLDEARAVAEAAPRLAGEALRRAEAASAMRRAPEPFDVEAHRRLVA